MKIRPLSFLLILLTFVGFLQAVPNFDVPGLQTLEIGDSAPDFNLKGIDGKMHSLSEYDSAKYLVIAFISNHCPDSQAAEPRLIQFTSDFADKGMKVVAINPNNPGSLGEAELGFSKYNDSYPEMILHAKEQGYNFPYLYDGDTQEVAKAYGCLATPHLFIFDEDRRLQYKGELDDSRFADPATVTRTGARDAMEDLLAGKAVALTETLPHGCSTKWIEKQASVAASAGKAKPTPVDIEVIDAKGVAALRQNGTEKLRLFNVWSTTCAPCVAEFPELVKTSHRFALREFELITISLDAPSRIDKAKQFLERNNVTLSRRLKPTLEEEGRTTNNYLYSEASLDNLVAALDPEWAGPIPHSVLVAEDGSIVWRHTGMVDGDEMRELILEQLGNYWDHN